MNKLIIIIFFASVSFLFNNCKEHTKGDGHNHGSEAAHAEEAHDEHENVNTTMLTMEQMKSIKIELGNIEKKQLTASLKANGLLKVPNQNRANATAFIGGVIKSILVQSGNTVTKGQTIATISNNSFITMQEEYITVLSKVDLAQLEFNRQNELQQGNAGALKNLQITETELKILKSRKASLKKQLELIGINPLTLTNENIQSIVKITSPISGVISNVMVNIGSYVDGNNTIAEIVDNSQLHLDLYVYEKDLAKLKEGQTIHFTLTNNPGKEYDADVYAISNTFEQNTKAIAIHAKVKGNKQGLIDGMSITALVSLENATLDAVPTDAIVSHEGQDYIFIVTDAHTEEEHHDHGAEETAEHNHDEHGHSHTEKEAEPKNEKGTSFEKIPVRKGTTDIGYSEITLLKEIPKNSKIVTKGAFFILAKMSNKGEGHQH
ncbi:MAG: efflux RND transporter periplasmic adaptor subunit [Saprospiraceae bacterium]|nr:efflux RND transporter periplasmic adaptor subunit [Candidatus Defluviibacterium haderslevense]